MKKRILWILAAVISIAAAGCSREREADVPGEKETVTLTMFSNLPDRKTGQGLVEQMIIDEYMEINENIEIQVEVLDDEAYKTKFKAYAMEGMPDIVTIWGQPSFLDEIVEAGLLAELDAGQYDAYGFVEGSLEGFTYDERLYGLPRNTDVQCIFYNEKLFMENGWEVPVTYEELLTLAGEIKKAGFVPMAMDGGDGWPLAVYLSDVLYKLTGREYGTLVSHAIQTGDFSAPPFLEAASLLKTAAEAGLFQNGYDSQDYSTAVNLFTNGQAAMYYMGSWEVSIALDMDIPEEIRTGIRAFTMPVIEGGRGNRGDIVAWNGGGYAVSADSEAKEEAIRFLNYMYQPDKLSRYGWENGAGMSAQDQSLYMTGEETELQKQVVELLNQADSLSGTPINDQGPSAFKVAMESEIRSMANGSISVEEFLERIGNACK